MLDHLAPLRVVSRGLDAGIPLKLNAHIKQKLLQKNISHGFWWKYVQKYFYWWECSAFYLTHLFPMYPFSTSWKHLKTLQFSDVFRGYRKSALGTNGLNEKVHRMAQLRFHTFTTNKIWMQMNSWCSSKNVRTTRSSTIIYLWYKK